MEKLVPYGDRLMGQLVPGMDGTFDLPRPGVTAAVPGCSLQLRPSHS